MVVVVVGRWVFLVARGMVLAPFVAVEHIVLKCCQAVLSWLKTFLPLSSLTDLATCANLPLTPVVKFVVLCSRRLWVGDEQLVFDTNYVELLRVYITFDGKLTSV
jgi:hypothetical protein